MSDAIHDVDHCTGKSRGVLVIDPSGRMVTLHPTAPVKPGWRLATREEVNAATDAANPPQPKAPAIEASDKPIEEVVHSLSVDAPLVDSSDRD